MHNPSEDSQGLRRDSQQLQRDTQRPQRDSQRLQIDSQWPWGETMKRLKTTSQRLIKTTKRHATMKRHTEAMTWLITATERHTHLLGFIIFNFFLIGSPILMKVSVTAEMIHFLSGCCVDSHHFCATCWQPEVFLCFCVSSSWSSFSSSCSPELKRAELMNILICPRFHDKAL